jgi:hypothetical protein
LSFGIQLKLRIGRSRLAPAPAELVEAVDSVEVTNTDQGRDGFQITFASGRANSPGAFDDLLISNPLLKPFNRVVLEVTLGLFPRVLIDGVITHLQFNPSQEPGRSTFSVTGEDVSVMMDLHEEVHRNESTPSTAAISKVIHNYYQYGVIPDVKSPSSDSPSSGVDCTRLRQVTDFAFLTQLATMFSCVFYMEPTDEPGTSVAYWGPPKREGAPQKALSFNMGAQTNVASINFQYNALKPFFAKGSVADRNTNQVIQVQTTRSMRLPLSSDPAWQTNQQNVRTRHFDGSGLNSMEANSRAQAETDNSVDAVSVSGEIDATVYGDVLRARRTVNVRGTGYTHDGTYYVKSVTHRIKPGEYKQSFTLTREGLGTTVQAVTQ